jgi:hypothetical protein
VWEPVVEEEKFYRVQALMKKNGRSKHNAARQPKHNYVLSGGLLWCGRCGSEMQAGAGTGQKGRRYHYYVCKNPECRFKAPADEVEGLILERIGYLASDREVLSGIVATTNERLRTELPNLKEQRDLLERDLEDVKSTAEGLINEWTALANGDGAQFLKEKLDDLGKRRGQIEESLASLEIAMGEVQRDTVNQETVAQALADFSEVFAEIKPYQQKELMRLVLHKAILGPDYMKMALYGRPPAIGPLSGSESRFQTFDWLPGLVSQSAILWDIVRITAKRIARGQVRLSALPHPSAVATSIARGAGPGCEALPLTCRSIYPAQPACPQSYARPSAQCGGPDPCIHRRGACALTARRRHRLQDQPGCVPADRT